MINKKQKQDINNLYQFLSKNLAPGPKTIGLIVTSGQSPRAVTDCLPVANQAVIVDASSGEVAENYLRELKDHLSLSKTVILQIGSNLEPAIYNQLSNIANSGRMDWNEADEKMYLEVPEESVLILQIDNDDLKNLNYDNLHDLVSPVVRL